MTATAVERRSDRRSGSRRHGLHLPRFAKVTLIVVAAIALLVVAVRLIADPIATRQTRQALDRLKGFDGDFQAVHITFFPPGYQITRLKLVEAGASPAAEPLVYAERVRTALDLPALLHGRLVASVRIEDPKIV